MQTATVIEVTRTYLEMRDLSELNGAKLDDLRIKIEEQRECSVKLFRFLYAEVGKNYHWIDRLPWTDEQIVAHLNKPENSIWLMTRDGETVGYRSEERRVGKECRSRRERARE